MNILMITNTYTPHVSGVARSVESFAGEFRRRGHRVLIIAPAFAGIPEQEADVIRIPAVRQFNGSDFSLPVPAPGRIASRVRRFAPDLIHSHHPFLLGDTALRLAASRQTPIVFTHHTMYERYTHYLPGDSLPLRRFVADLATGYCNLCDAVIAPSATVAEHLRERGVRARIEVIPTGIEPALFAGGDRAAFRRDFGIPADAFVVGHVGRLAREKNLGFLARSVALFLAGCPEAHFLVAGGGPAAGVIREVLQQGGIEDRLHEAGVMSAGELRHAYAAMDVFAFASQTETQGIVLIEALAAGIPVVAVDAPGVREVIRDGDNGLLLGRESRPEFAAALRSVAAMEPTARLRLREGAIRTAGEFALARCAARTEALYLSLIAQAGRTARGTRPWRRLEGEWNILRNVTHAVGDAFGILAGSDRFRTGNIPPPLQ